MLCKVMSLENIRRAADRLEAIEEKQGLRSFKDAKPLSPAFSKAKAAQQPLHVSPPPAEREKGRLFCPPDQKERNFSHVPLINKTFNAAHNDNKPEQYQGRNSSMVKNQQPQHLNQPPPAMRKEADRQKHKNALKAEQSEVAQLEELKAATYALKQKKQNSQKQSRGMRV